MPTDLTYDGTYASFTATGLSGYAVTAARARHAGAVGGGAFGDAGLPMAEASVGRGEGIDCQGT